jgi:hypothetical protein
MSTNPPELSQLQNKLVESTGSSCRQVVVVFEDPRAGVQIKASTKPRKHTRVFGSPTATGTNLHAACYQCKQPLVWEFSCDAMAKLGYLYLGSYASS